MCRAAVGHKKRGGFHVIVVPALLVAAAFGLPIPRAAADDGAPSAPPLKRTLDSIADKLNLRTKEGDVPDFVKRTRPDRATLKFIPTGLPHPIRALPPKSADEIQAIKNRLDAAAAAQLQPQVPGKPLDLVSQRKAGKRAARPPAQDPPSEDSPPPADPPPQDKADSDTTN